MKKTLPLALAATLLAGCAVDPYTGETTVSKTAVGAGTGAMTGAALGALVSKNKGKGALIGAAAGAAIGTGVGLYMDNQDKELRAELQGTGVSVTKIDAKNIVLNMPGDITFAVGSDALSQDFFAVLNSVAKVLKKYDKTVIRVAGHTDNTGSSEGNLKLSERRASAVANYLISQGVKASRFTTEGYGSLKPVASNTTAQGRASNRRVEINLMSVE